MPPSTFRQGRILWARLRAQSGKKELHPAVIITADKDIVQPEQFDPRARIQAVNAVADIGVSTEFANTRRTSYCPTRPAAADTPLLS
jgi:hypothetical protein